MRGILRGVALALGLLATSALAQTFTQVDLAKETTATTGTGATLVVGGAVTGFLTIEAAATQAGKTIDEAVVHYGIVDGANRESGPGTYDADTNTLTRCTSGVDCTSTNSGNRIDLSGSAFVGITAIAASFDELWTAINAVDLDFQADTGGALAITEAETLSLVGDTSGIDTAGSGNTVTFSFDPLEAEAGIEGVIDHDDLQGTLTLAGDIDGAHNANDLDELAVEAELEAVLDLADLQGDLALGTQTSGNYVAEVADGTGIDGTCASEGCTYTPTFDVTEVESDIENAIDTLANLTSVQGLTITLADAAADAFFGWDDTASAYENLTAAEAIDILETADGSGSGLDADLLDGISSADFLTEAEASAAYQPLDSDLTSWAGVTRASGYDTFAATPSCANLSSLLTDEAFACSDAELGALAGLTSAANRVPYFTGSGTAALFAFTPSDAGFDVLVGWDDSDSQYESLALATIATEASPAAGDFLILYGAEGDLRKVDWDDLPGAAGLPADPDVDAIAVWDDTEGATNWFTVHTGLDLNLTDSRLELDFTELNTFTLGAGAATGIIFDAGATDPAIEVASGSFTIDIGGTNELSLNATSLDPGADDGLALGTASLGYSDLFLAPGGLVEFNGTTDSSLTCASGECTIEGDKLKQAGKQTIWVPAGAMTPAATNGCAAADTTINSITFPTKACDQTTDESVWFSVAFPKNWNEGTVTARVFWTATGTPASETIDVDISCGSFANDAAIDVTGMGTAVSHGDTGIAANDLHVSGEGTAITCANAAADTVTWFQVMRDVSADNLAEDMLLIGVKLFFTDDDANDD